MKIVIGLKNGKSFQKEISKQDAEALYGRVLGETIKGELLGFSSCEFTITGGSDSDGFPMRKDLPGTARKKILMTKGTGFKGKLRKKRFDGLRIKKSVAGNTVHEKTHQLNLKCVKGDAQVEKEFAPAPEVPAEGEAPKAEAPKTEVPVEEKKKEAPIEEVKEEKKEKPKEETPKEEPKEEKPSEEKKEEAPAEEKAE